MKNSFHHRILNAVFDFQIYDPCGRNQLLTGRIQNQDLGRLEFRLQLIPLSEMCGLVAGDERSLILKKVEPWNSVRVTFNIPADAAERLRELAQHPNSVLREFGVLAVQIGDDCVMSTNASVGSTSSSTETKPSDVMTGSGSQAISQPATSVVFSSSIKTNSQPTDPGFPPFKVPTMIMSSCSPCILPPVSGAVRTIALEHPIPDVISSLNVVQPRPVGLVRWPNVIPGHPGLDAVAVRFAVPPVPMKEFSQGLCFISPLRATVSQNIASSSPLLVNLLQTQRQHGITAVPSQPVVQVNTSAMIVPQKRRRNTSTRKAKHPRNEQEAYIPTSSLQFTADSTLHFAQTHLLPVTTVCAPGIQMTPTTDNQTLMESEKLTDVSPDTGSARRMINPYTGNLELVDIAEDDGLSVPVCSSNEVLGSSGTSVIKATVSLNNNQHVTVSGLSNQILPTFIPSKPISTAVEASESGTWSAGRNLLAKSEDIPCTEKPTMVSVSTISTSSQYIDWYTASQSDKHNGLQSNTTQLSFSGGLSGVKHPEIPESVKSFNITSPSESMGGGSTKAGTYSSYERCLSTVKPFSINDQPAVSSLSASNNVTMSGLESVRLKTVSEIIPPQSSNVTTTCSSVTQLSTSQTDLIQMAFTLAKQNGSALHVSSLVDSWNKNAGLLQSSLQSLHGLHNIALATTSIPLHSSSTATTASSSAQSRPKNVDGLSSATTVVSSDTCFFPAVSCFPPEHRRKSAVSVGGFGINPEPQLQPGTSSVVSCLVSTLPAVKILTSSSMPLEVRTCGVSVVPSTVSNPITVSTSISAESNLLSASTERGPLPNTDTKKSIPLLTNLVPSSWPLIPNVLTVPLVTPTPLSGSPILHCVTRAPLTPDGKLAGLSAAVTNAKGTVVPLAGRFCIPLSTSQAALVTANADKQNIESIVTSGIRPHAIMLTDNLTRLKLSIAGNGSKSSGKQASSSKDRRGNITRTDDAAVQRSSGKSHLTVAQLLDMAKNARLQQTVCDDEQMKLPDEPSSAVVTSASLQPQSTLTASPLRLSSLSLQSSSTLMASQDPSHVQLTSMPLSGSTAGNVHTAPSTSAVLQTNVTTSSVVSQSTTAVVASTLFPHLLAQPLNTVTNISTVSAPLTAATVDVPGKVSVESSSASTSLPMPAYSVHPPLSIMSPRYPLNLTESVKKAMRGIGLYPSPPVSPITSLQTFGSAKLPEIRPYPVSTVCTVPVSELAARKLLQDRSTVVAPVMSQQLLLTASNSAAISSVNSFGPSVANLSSTSYQTLNAANCVSHFSLATVCAEVTENRTDIKNGNVISHSDSANVHVINAVTSVGSASVTDCVTTCNSLFTVSQSGDVRPESVMSKNSAHLSPAVICSVPEPELRSCVRSEDNSLPGHAVSSYVSLKDGLHAAKTVNCLNGRLSASSGDSDIELRRDILEGLSSVETDAGLSSLQSSPCSAEMASVLDSRRDTNTAVAYNTDIMNCTTAVNHRHSHNAGSLNADLDSPSCEGSLLLQCDMTVKDGYITAVSVASGVSATFDDVSDDHEIDTAVDAADLLYTKVATYSSNMSSKNSNTILKRNRLQTAISNIGNRLTTRRKVSADVETNISCTSNSVEHAVEHQTVTSVGSVTRMTTRSSQRTAVSTTELTNKTSSNDTKLLDQKMPVKTPERRAHRVSESSNHSQDLPITKSVVVTQRRSARTLVAKVVDVKKSETVTTCQDTDSGISLRSRRHAQKMNSVEVVTPRKRSGLRATAGSKEVLCLEDSTEDAVGVLDGSGGLEVNVNDHE